MAVIFACSFDAGSPFGGWTTFPGGATIVAGRNVNGATFNGNFTKTFAGATAVTAATAWIATTSNPVEWADLKLSDPTGVGFTGGSARLTHTLGDGRLRFDLGSDFGNDFFVINGYADHDGPWAFMELEAVITQTVVPFDATRSTVTISISANAYVNNQLIGSASNSHSGILNNTQIPAGTFSLLTLSGNCTIDDVDLSNPRIGDAKVFSDDTTVTVQTSAPDITQVLWEIASRDPAAAPDNTQSLFEVILGPLLPPPCNITLACPLLNTATIGVPFAAAMIVGGTPTLPVTFDLIAGALPPGLSLDHLTGIISGTPTATGTFAYTVRVTDAAACTTTASCGLIVGGIPPACILVPAGVSPTLEALTEPLERTGS